ncbi:MAG: class I SAM-dependent methyltransferase [Janthinobacterium lividum]
MSLDVVDLRTFYAAPLGRVAQKTITRIVRTWWHDTHGLAVAGLGYAIPFLEPFRDEAVRTIALMPAEQGIVHWPVGGTSATTLVEGGQLPLPDGSIDRVLLVHMLEPTEHPREVLAEVWRVLTPGGRMIAVACNRRSMWARVDTTPFGSGQPFSKRQLAALLRETLFSPERFGEALYMPPLEQRALLKFAPFFERAGKRMALPGAGVHLVEATKQLYRPVMLRRLAPMRYAIPRLEPRLQGSFRFEAGASQDEVERTIPL